MEQLLQQIIEQNERLIAAVDKVASEIEHMKYDLRTDLMQMESRAGLASIGTHLEEIALAIGGESPTSVLTEIHEELKTANTNLELLDTSIGILGDNLGKS